MVDVEECVKLYKFDTTGRLERLNLPLLSGARVITRESLTSTPAGCKSKTLTQTHFKLNRIPHKHKQTQNSKSLCIISLTTTRSIFLIPSLSDESLTAALTSMGCSPSFMGMTMNETDRVDWGPTLNSWRYLLRLEAELHTCSTSIRSTRTLTRGQWWSKCTVLFSWPSVVSRPKRHKLTVMRSGL